MLRNKPGAIGRTRKRWTARGPGASPSELSEAGRKAEGLCRRPAVYYGEARVRVGVQRRGQLAAKSFALGSNGSFDGPVKQNGSFKKKYGFWWFDEAIATCFVDF